MQYTKRQNVLILNFISGQSAEMPFSYFSAADEMAAAPDCGEWGKRYTFFPTLFLEKSRVFFVQLFPFFYIPGRIVWFFL
ncbi:MAG: hypothetical protein IJ112_05445 [Oscillospiraceae bacterium]|nr:hypothetical protein [Oscillospiraceae bacterium]